MRRQAIPLIMKDIPVTLTLTVMRRQATPLLMKDFLVTFTLTVLRCASQALKLNGAAGLFHTIV